MADLNNEKKTINKTHSARFPAPPFPQQKQPFPGLAGKCNRVPIMERRAIREAVD